MELVDVYKDPAIAIDVLYRLLKERTPEQSISHRKMPTMEEHIAFVMSRPYRAWYLIQGPISSPLGSIYLSKQREIGISIFRNIRGMGYGSEALRAMMSEHRGPFYANVSPYNEPSARFFEKHGFTIRQLTFVRDK